MKVMNFVNLINQAFRFVIQTSQEYCIDESHALKHSMEVFNYANNIYESEVKKKQNIIVYMCTSFIKYFQNIIILIFYSSSSSSPSYYYYYYFSF
jgi:hypothetical protein